MYPRLYWEIARRAFRRQAAYRTANLAGLFTNVCFGYLRGAAFLALYATQATIAGYSVTETLTYAWITQALIMVVIMWGWYDVEETIRSGDVITDLARPYSYLGYWLARDLGRAGYYVVFRGAPIMLVGELLFDLHWPTSPLVWLAFAASIPLGVTVSFAWRFLMNLTAFWTTDARGIGLISMGLVTLLSGLIVPLPYFPEPVRDVLLALPFAAIMHVPADIFAERLTGGDALRALAFQAAWSLALLGLAQGIVTLATRRVVVQGG